MFRRWLPAIAITLALPACRKHQDAVALATMPDLPVITAVSTAVNKNIGGYYQALPTDYSTGDRHYPLLLFLHGGGGFGNGGSELPRILEEGIPKLLDRQAFPSEFLVKGNRFSFIHLAPQFRKYPSMQDVRSFVQYAVDHFRVDTGRIYVAGMSLGGRFACDAAAAYPGLFAAVVPMAGIPDTPAIEYKCSALAKQALPLWVFHNDQDQVFNIELTKTFIGMISSYHVFPAPRFTIFSSMGLMGHDAWTRATDPGFREDGLNIYEWMLQYGR